MAESTNYQRTETLPTNMLGQFYAGVPGQNVPGIMPLLNQDLVNKLMGFGVEGANPYTYTGNRIADFTPAQQEAFRLHCRRCWRIPTLSTRCRKYDT